MQGLYFHVWATLSIIQVPRFSASFFYRADPASCPPELRIRYNAVPGFMEDIADIVISLATVGGGFANFSAWWTNLSDIVHLEFHFVSKKTEFVDIFLDFCVTLDTTRFDLTWFLPLLNIKIMDFDNIYSNCRWRWGVMLFNPPPPEPPNQLVAEHPCSAHHRTWANGGNQPFG